MRAAVFFTCLLLAASAGVASEPRGFDARTIEKRVGRPAVPTRAHAVVEEARRAGPEALVETARALSRCGGLGAADALLPLLRYDDRRVRAAALRGLGRVGLRRPAYARAVRRIVTWSRDEDLQAGVRVLGRLGDGSDIEALISMLEHEQEGVAVAAHASLMELTGAKLPRNKVRWSYWQRTVGTERTRAVRTALQALEADRTPTDETRRLLLSPAGLLDLPRLLTRVGRWLRSDQDDLIVLACEIVSAHGLLAAWSDLETASSFRGRSPGVRRGAEQTLAALGVTASEPSDESPPTAVAEAPEPPAPVAAGGKEPAQEAPAPPPAAPAVSGLPVEAPAADAPAENAPRLRFRVAEERPGARKPLPSTPEPPRPKPRAGPETRAPAKEPKADEAEDPPAPLPPPVVHKRKK